MNDHWVWLAPLIAAVVGHLVGAIVFGAKIFARLSVLETTVAANRTLANGLAKEVHEMDAHGSRNVPLLNERLINEHVRIDTLTTRIEDIGQRLHSIGQQMEERQARLETIAAKLEQQCK